MPREEICKDLIQAWIIGTKVREYPFFPRQEPPQLTLGIIPFAAKALKKLVIFWDRDNKRLVQKVIIQNKCNRLMLVHYPSQVRLTSSQVRSRRLPSNEPLSRAVASTSSAPITTMTNHHRQATPRCRSRRATGKKWRADLKWWWTCIHRSHNSSS